MSARLPKGLDGERSSRPAAAAVSRRAKSIRFSNVGAAGQPSSIRTSSGPDPRRRREMRHSGSAIARMIEGGDGRRSARIGHGVRAGSVSFVDKAEEKPQGRKRMRRGAAA